MKRNNPKRQPQKGQTHEILGYYSTPHFMQQLERRRIDTMLVSICLAKGRPHRVRMRKQGVLALRLDKQQLEEAVRDGFAEAADLTAVTEMVTVTKNRNLITAYYRWGDWGIGS